MFSETNTGELIKNIVKERDIMGTSAGSIVLKTQIKSNKYWNAKFNINYADIKYADLNLVPFNIIPHYMRENHKQWTYDVLYDS